MKNTLPNFITIGLGSLLILGVSYAQFYTNPSVPPPRSNKPSIQQNLTENQLQEIAQRLSSRGYAVNTMTTSAEDIQRALKFFQADNHLPSTGIVDSATLSALGLVYDEEFERAPASLD